MSAEQRLQELRLRYLASLSSKLDDLRSHWIEAQTGNATALDEFRTKVHKLAGSAPAYGLTSLGATARTLDEALIGEFPPDELARLFQRLDRQIQEELPL
ncbi:MAG: Hpt domain-containing protein [Chromatiales bacterium]|nr:Hpt domain-containing protein [Chromatiales bacterium]